MQGMVAQPGCLGFVDAVLEMVRTAGVATDGLRPGSSQFIQTEAAARLGQVTDLGRMSMRQATELEICTSLH